MSKEAAAVLKELGAKESNPWLILRRTSPNVSKLVDGGIQRKAVSPSRFALHPSVNKDKVGFYK